MQLRSTGEGLHVRLEKLVAALELLVLALDRLDAVDNLEEVRLEDPCLSVDRGGETSALVMMWRILRSCACWTSKHLGWGRCTAGQLADGLLFQRLSRLVSHLLDLLHAPPGTHGSGIALVVLLVLGLDRLAVPRDDDRPGGLAGAQGRPY